MYFYEKFEFELLERRNDDLNNKDNTGSFYTNHVHSMVSAQSDSTEKMREYMRQ